jgi:membrane-associated protein
VSDPGGVGSWFSVLVLQSLWWGFGIFFIAALTEMWFPPFPGDAVFFFGLVTLQAHDLSVYGAFLGSSLGGLVGFTLLYWLGRARGRRLFGRQETGLFSVTGLERVERWFHRWGGIVIVMGRFLAGVRSAVPLVAGVGDYPKVAAVSLGAVSILIWNGLLAVVAVVLHANWDRVSVYWRTYSVAVWTVIIVVALVGAVRFLMHRRGGRSDGSA